MDKRYVQHISGQGEKFELGESSYDYKEMWILEKRHDGLRPCVPKSEYVLCEKPEVWIDITAECLAEKTCGTPHAQVLEDKQHVIAHVDRGYRLRKVQLYKRAVGLDPQWAFIVEKREP